MVTEDLILAKLKEIEEKEQVKILYAIESGSRGWGFESKDSDYDVRFIYMHPLDWYLSIKDERDVIEYLIFDQLDLSGWDIKKALKLFKNSNPPLYEWLSSPIVYLERGKFVRTLKDLTPKFYSPVSCAHHYLSMAKGNYKAYLTGQKVFNGQTRDDELTQEIKKLLSRKRSGEEIDLEDRIEIINNFLETKIKYFEDYVKTLKVRNLPQEDPLDDLFREALKSYNDLPEMSE